MEQKKKRRLVWWLVTIIILLFAIVIGGGLYLLRFALQPYGKLGKKEASSMEWAFKNYPFLEPWVDSLNQVGALRDTFINNPEGLRMHALFIEAAEPTKKTAVIVHGYTDEAIRMLPIGYLYNKDLGYNVLLPDLHYHGKSDGEAIQMGWKDRLDVMQWMHVANELFGDSTQMAVHGISMGGATTMMVSGMEQPYFTKCFVEDCGYISVWDQFSYQLNRDFHLPNFPLLYTASALCELKYGWNFKEASSLKQVEKSQLPMFFIHGAEDSYVPTWNVYPLYEAKSEPKEIWVVPGAQHADSYRNNKEEYTRRVGEFVGKYIN